MKRLLTPFLLIILTLSIAQAQETPTSTDKKVESIFNKLSFTMKAGSPSYALSNLGNNGNNFGQFNFAEIGASFKLKSRLSFGVSMMGGLGNCSEMYQNAEGVLIEIDDDEDDEIDDDDNEMDEDDDDGDDDDNEDCGDDEMDALMATMTYMLSEDVPVFVQASVGYSMGEQAPAYSVFVGYQQKIFSRLGISGGVRFSEVMSKLPADVQNFSRSGLKAEFGIHWNF